MAYYTLLQREPGGLWYPQFGAYDREDVAAEREDMKSQGIEAKYLRIIQTASARAHVINARIADLNKGTAS